MKTIFLVRAGLRSLYCDKPVRVKFVNHSGKEVQLYWINYVGECEKAFKILDGKSEVIDTFETHPWIAANARNKKVSHAFTVGNNLVYYPLLGPNGGKYAVAEIRKAPGNFAILEFDIYYTHYRCFQSRF
jgi:von Hippel-Lindau disease tumour suppressor protein.